MDLPSHLEPNLGGPDPRRPGVGLKITGYTKQVPPVGYLELSLDEPDPGTLGVSLKVTSYVRQVPRLAIWNLTLMN